MIMVRPETKPDDVHGMLAAKGILTSRGGAHQPRRRRRAPVRHAGGRRRRQPLTSTWSAKTMTVGNKVVVKEGDWISIDGTHRRSLLGQIPTVMPDLSDPYLRKFSVLGGRDSAASRCWANADYPARRPARPQLRRRRASASAAPSTCSSRPSACRSSRR